MSGDEATDDQSVGLHQSEPREQFGARTGAVFDFQYHQAAADSLQVLDDTQVACVYCEWHDDYVVESAGVVAYRFHQVKTRSASKGPWKAPEFFGVPTARGKQPPTAASTDSIFARFLDHTDRFGARCELFVFVTDVGIASEFRALLDAVMEANDPASLPEAQEKVFRKLHDSLVLAFDTLSDTAFFWFLQRLRVQPAVGSVANIHECRTLIGGRILQLSEVDLTQSESQKIGAELVAAVKDRSHRVLAELPESLEALRAAKGLVIEDILKILSLSAAGYRELKSAGRDAVVALSRLHRLLARSNMPAAMIPDLCRIKAAWDAWWITQRHVVNALDVIALKSECGSALTVHVDGKLDFNGLRGEALSLATKYRQRITSTEPLTDELVFGLMLSMTVEAEA